MFRVRLAALVLAAATVITVLTVGLCQSGREGRQRAAPEVRCSAKALFEKASREYHIPSAQAHGRKRKELEDQAASLYYEIMRNHSDQPYWAAQALRSLANIRAAQTNLTEATRLYAEVGERFPRQEFEVLMSWKSGADLLWEAGRTDEAKKFYAKLVRRFDNADAPAVVQSVLRGSKARLGG